MKYETLYDALYESGYHNNFDLNNTSEIYAHIKDFIPLGHKLLDIGCSHGAAVKDLVDKGYDAYGIDISERAIELCKKQNIKNCKKASIVKTEYPDNSFDALVSSDTFEHLDPKEIGPAIDECKRLLKTKGVAILSIATKPEINRTFDFIAKKYKLKDLHTSVYESRLWHRRFSSLFRILAFIDQKDKAIFILTH